MNLDVYFDRIGYGGPRTPTLETLNAISLAHVKAIPFENLDVLQGRDIDLDPCALERKLVHARRGGYCFEQNTLMLTVLTELGFEVRPLSARVRYQMPREFTPARTHLLIRVELEESWLVDVGVGTLSLTGALRLADSGPQTTPHETRRLLREDGLIYHQVLFGEEWQDVCELTLEEMPPIDRVLANWYTSTHPGSHMKSRLLVARALGDGRRIAILNRELIIRSRVGSAERQLIKSPQELLAILAERFGIQLPADTSFSCPALDW